MSKMETRKGEYERSEARQMWEECDKSKPRMDIRLCLHERGELTTREIAEHEERNKSNVGKQLRKMEDQGIVKSNTQSNNTKVWSVADEDWEPPQYVEDGGEEPPTVEELHERLQRDKDFIVFFGGIFLLSLIGAFGSVTLGYNASGFTHALFGSMIGILVVVGVAVEEVYR